jgi:hypothetical protein
VTTPAAVFHYVVRELLVVEPSDVSVLEPTAGRTLTLVTCYPFSYIGTAPKRFIVRADEIAPQAARRSGVFASLDSCGLPGSSWHKVARTPDPPGGVKAPSTCVARDVRAM